MEAKVRPEVARKKAELLAGGAVKIPSGFKLPFPASRSTAGPGAGSVAVVFSFGNTRAKKAVSRDEGEFELVLKEHNYSISRNGRPFIDQVELIPTLLHAPYQAFVNLEHDCVMNCAFCASPRLGHEVIKDLTDDKIIAMIKEASGKDDFQSVAFTSAVPETSATTAKRMTNLVRRTRELFPGVPIGVEPYATRPDEIEALREAGADEIKLNIESFDRDIFEKVCPKRDYDSILHAINHSCEVFGRNNVCSNIIFGLGEDDENVIEGTKVLANMGAVATLRALRRNEFNVEALQKALGPLRQVTADRMLTLARLQKKVLEEYDLTPLKFKTMCHACLSCDLVPFWDV